MAGALAVALLATAPAPGAPEATLASAQRPLVDSAAFRHQGELAFVSRGALWVLDGSSGSLRPVTEGPAAAPVYSHDGRWLAYVTTGPSSPFTSVLAPAPGQLWIAHSNGTGARRVPGLTNAGDLSWSPTADLLAVLGGTNAGIWLVTPQGVRHELPGTSQAANFVWSPDGRKLAFSGYGQYGALEADSVAGGSPVLWQAEHNNPAYPQLFNPDIPAGWLPKGGGLLFWIDLDNSASLEADGLPLYLVADPDGPSSLLGTTLVKPSSITTSSGGEAAIVDGDDRYQWMNKTVERCSTAGVSCAAVPKPAADVSIDPSWSPDGHELVYAQGPASSNDDFPQSVLQRWYSRLSLWTIASTSNRPVELRGTDGGTTPRWSSGGRRLMYEADDAVWLMARIGGTPVKVASPLFAPDQWPTYYGQVDWAAQFAWWSG